MLPSLQRVMRKLYVSDLDGTLLTQEARLSHRSHTILCDLLSRGLPFTIATARTHYSVLPLLRGLSIQLPLILQNGALLYDMQGRHILSAVEIAPAAYVQVCEAMAAHGVEGFVYCAEAGQLRCCYRALQTPAMQQFYQERRKRFEKPFFQVAALQMLQHPIYITMNAPRETLQPVVDALTAVAGLTLSYYRDVYRKGIWYLEVSAADASKQHGIERLREQFGFDFVTGFGDNANDLPLFAACDRKIAVGNAAEVLAVRADRMIGTNEEDAVARFLQQEWEHQLVV